MIKIRYEFKFTVYENSDFSETADADLEQMEFEDECEDDGRLVLAHAKLTEEADNADTGHEEYREWRQCATPKEAAEFRSSFIDRHVRGLE